MADGCRCPLGDNPPRQRDSSVNCNINWWINENGRLIIKYMIWVPHMYPQFLEWAEHISSQLPDTADIALVGSCRIFGFRTLTDMSRPGLDPEGPP